MIIDAACLRRCVTDGRIGISPFDSSLLKAASYSFTLGNVIRVPLVEPQALEAQHQAFTDVAVPSDGYLVPPRGFVLGVTRETVNLHDSFCCLLSTKPSLARQGLNVTQGSFYAEPTTDNPFVLEISNNNSLPVRLFFAQPIVQGAFVAITHPPTPNSFTPLA